MKKSNPSFPKILGQSVKGKQTSFFFRPNNHNDNLLTDRSSVFGIDSNVVVDNMVYIAIQDIFKKKRTTLEYDKVVRLR